MDMAKIYNLISGTCNLAVLALILLAVASIVILFFAFRSDFSQD